MSLKCGSQTPCEGQQHTGLALNARNGEYHLVRKDRTEAPIHGRRKRKNNFSLISKMKQIKKNKKQGKVMPWKLRRGKGLRRQLRPLVSNATTTDKCFQAPASLPLSPCGAFVMDLSIRSSLHFPFSFMYAFYCT